MKVEEFFLIFNEFFLTINFLVHDYSLLENKYYSRKLPFCMFSNEFFYILSGA